MKILGLDSSDGAWSVALVVDGICVFDEGGEVRDSLGAMSAAVQQALSGAGIMPAGLDRIACSRGPGGFTGVRVAVGLAQGLSLGGGVPIAPVSTLAALAQSGPGGRTVAALDARMGEVYWGEFLVSASSPPEPLQAERLSSPQMLQVAPGAIAVGRGFAAHPEMLSRIAARQAKPEARPTARVVAQIGSWLEAGDLVLAPEFEPVYLRNQVAG